MRLSRRVPVPAVLAAALLLPAPPPAVAVDHVSGTVFGYRVVALSRDTLLTQASAVWNVAAGTDYHTGETQTARTFVSLGGGCVNDDCYLVSDDLVLYAGTEVTVDPTGAVTYRAWYDVPPLSPTYVPLAVSAGDDVRGTIEDVSGSRTEYRITLENLTDGTSWTTTTPYVLLGASAQFVVMSSYIADEFGDVYPMMPTLEPTRFDQITVNGANPQLRPVERVWLGAYAEREIVGAPSLPQADGNGFGACAWTTTCAVPPDL